MARAHDIRTVPIKAEVKAENIGMSESKREEVAEALSRFLASTYALYQKSLFYHWNVTGSHFVSLHKLFEGHYEELHKAGDEVAERIRALGHFSPGTLAEFASLSLVREDQKLPGSDYEMVLNLLESHQICSKEAKDVYMKAEKAGDQVTMDLLVQRMAFHDKAAWMLRALRLDEEQKF